MSLLLAAVLALGAPSSSAQDPSCAASTARLGQPAAAAHLDVYMDPTDASSLVLASELRRFVAERPGEFSVSIHVVSTPGSIDPRAEVVRQWTRAMTAQGRFFAALRAIRRDGSDRIFVRLLEKDTRKGLAEEVGADPAEHERTFDTRCFRAAVSTSDGELRTKMRGRGVTVYRLPMFEVDDLVFEDSAVLDKLRPAIGRRRTRAQRGELRPRPAVPPVRGVSERLERPELGGVQLGGLGLPHRFILMARDEDDPNLFMLLPPLLRYRAAHPGRVTVQVVARGPSWGASALRQRLCAARRTGLVAAYVRHLGTDPGARAVDPATVDLLDTLDRVDEEGCTAEPDPAELGLPDGGWLDGLVRTRSELEMIDGTLKVLDAAARPLSSLLGTTDDPV